MGENEQMTELLLQGVRAEFQHEEWFQSAEIEFGRVVVFTSDPDTAIIKLEECGFDVQDEVSVEKTWGFDDSAR